MNRLSTIKSIVKRRHFIPSYLSIINPNFSTPSTSTNNYVSLSYNTNAITGWTLSGNASTGIYICNGVTTFSPTIPHQIQYTTIRFGTSPTSHSFTQSIYAGAGSYRISFYARSRPGYGILDLTCSFNGTSKQTTGLTEADGWVLYSFTTSISTSGNYDLVFTTTGQTDCYINFTGTTQFQTLLLNKPPWARYSASNWSETTLTDLTTNARHATTANLTTTTGSGNGATASITYLTGTSTGSIRFPPGSLPTTYTVCSITSLTTSGGPLLQSGPSNPFLCGHWGNQRGIVYYNGVWITPEVSIGTPTDFVNVVTTNSESVAIPNNALIDGTGYATSNSGSHTANFLTINNGGWVTSTTPFRFSQLIIFDQGLTTEEMYIVSNALKTYLTSGVLQ